VAPTPNHYQMDIAYFGKFKYLIVIGTNNRYMWSVQIKDKSMETIVSALNTLINFETFRDKFGPSGLRSFAPFPIFIDCDGEKGFYHLDLEPRLVRINSKPDKYHNRLSIINRAIRTIRDYAYRAFETKDDIAPSNLSQILHFYNNDPHKTLSRLIGFNVTPKMRLEDLELEAFIVKKLFHANMKEREKKLKIGTKVTLYHPKEFGKKVRFQMEPGIYTITSYKNGMYEVVEDQDVKNKQVVPGFYLGEI
jgi:hypothetical protein